MHVTAMNEMPPTMMSHDMMGGMNESMMTDMPIIGSSNKMNEMPPTMMSSDIMMDSEAMMASVDTNAAPGEQVHMLA